MVWSIMAAADEAGRAKLDVFLRDVEVSSTEKTNGAMYPCLALDTQNPPEETCLAEATGSTSQFSVVSVCLE